RSPPFQQLNDSTWPSHFPRNLAAAFTHYLCERKKPTNNQQYRGTIMKTKLTKTKFKCASSLARQLFRSAACLGAVILICTSASAQNLFVSGSQPTKNCLGGCGAIFKFTWDAGQSIFASGLTDPWDVAFDNAGNLFVVDYA